MKNTLVSCGMALFAVALSVPSIAAPVLKATSVSRPVELRGYGKVSVSFAPNRVEFTCESSEKADLLLGKLLADLFWDAGQSHSKKTVKVGSALVVVHHQPMYGMLIAARDQNRVIVLGGTDLSRVVAAAKQESLFQQKGRVFAPSKPYPIYLDFFDLRAFKFYTSAMSSPYGMKLDTHNAFVKQFGLGGLTFQEPATNFQNPAPGVVQWAPSDYEVRNAERTGTMIIPSLWLGGEVGLWIHNDYPHSMMQPSPSAITGSWGGFGASGAHYLSWGLPEAEANATIGQFARQVGNRYKHSPAVGGWHLYAGSPGGEMAYHDRTTEVWDYSASGQEGFRNWLRDQKKLTLSTLGARWYGDVKRFKSWQEVRMPEGRAFFGDLTGGELRIRDGWQWLKADANQNVTEKAPDVAGNKWIPVNLPPSQEQSLFPNGAAYYRTSFDPTSWETKNRGKDVYLTCDVNIRSDEGTQVWLNDQYLGAFKAQHQPGPFAVAVSGKLRAGKNELVLRAPSGGNPDSEGKILGPIALTTTAPSFYPFLGKHANARWVDLRGWQAYGTYRSHVLAAKAARAIDGERSLILSSGSLELGDYTGELAASYGMGLQTTGREGWYFPWYARGGIVGGYYGTAEPSGTTRGSNLDRMIGWSLIDGDSNVDMFWNIEDYIKQEQETGWFTKNQNLLRLFGKSLPEKPKIVILHSAKTLLLGSNAPMEWDMGRGEFHQAHYDYAYATEREVKNGQINSFPVIFDSGSEFMDDETLAGIEKYVRNGGTFVALHQTGRHSLLEPNTYPIAKLSGFKVVGNRSGKIKFGTDLPLFKAWQNREFEGDGSSIDYLNKDSAKGNGTALQTETNEATSLAKWEDGSIAVGYRKLGKGRVITLGSNFWRSGKDVAGAWVSSSELEAAFFERLFTDLGIQRNSQSSDKNVWTRKVITKNGLQEWLLAFNSGEARQADVSFKATIKPSVVMDLTTNQPVDFTYSSDGWVKIAGVDFGNQATRAFGVRRTNLLGGLPFWWNEKTTYWKRSAQGASAAPIANNWTIPFEQWKVATEAKDESWMKVGFDDSKWQSLNIGPWNFQKTSLQNHRGAALYRAKFTVPAHWKGRTINLNLYSFNTPVVYDQGEFFLNGRKVIEYSARGGSHTLNYDVTSLLKAGENVLSVKVQGGGEMSGVAGAVWLEPERTLNPSIDLKGNWQSIGADNLSRVAFELPGATHAKYVEREVDIPASWKGRQVFLHIESPKQWMEGVLINGRTITYNTYWHQFGLRTQINITPFVRYGASNRIQLCPSASSVATPDKNLEISRIFVGCTQ